MYISPHTQNSCPSEEFRAGQEWPDSGIPALLMHRRREAQGKRDLGVDAVMDPKVTELCLL